MNSGSAAAAVATARAAVAVVRLTTGHPGREEVCCSQNPDLLSGISEFCFQRLAIAFWSSRMKKNIDDPLVNFLFGNAREKLVFFAGISVNVHRQISRFFGNRNKPLALKELRKVWEKLGPDLQFDKGEYDESNTLLLDDSQYKVICNPEK
ncbi:hypothetical protein SAY86_010862 [Trapa natans]|uniref:FCP1 homology domain-containing protein n=1 Tax=Trapa natans TaxID=22666 RepID=A0AAN7LL86_TRANT|nr:hypothetical protein SAY86_010862 [Trapa natans]